MLVLVYAGRILSLPPIAVTILLNCHMTSRQGAKTHCVDVPLINSVNRRMDRWMDGLINLHPNISMYILQTVLHSRAPLVGDNLFSPLTLICDVGMI